MRTYLKKFNRVYILIGLLLAILTQPNHSFASGITQVEQLKNQIVKIEDDLKIIDKDLSSMARTAMQTAKVSMDSKRLDASREYRDIAERITSLRDSLDALVVQIELAELTDHSPAAKSIMSKSILRYMALLKFEIEYINDLMTFDLSNALLINVDKFKQKMRELMPIYEDLSSYYEY